MSARQRSVGYCCWGLGITSAVVLGISMMAVLNGCAADEPVGRTKTVK